MDRIDCPWNDVRHISRSTFVSTNTDNDWISDIEARLRGMIFPSADEFRDFFVEDGYPSCRQPRVIRTTGKLATFGHDDLFTAALIPKESQPFVLFAIVRHKL